MAQEIDFKVLATDLLSRANVLVPEWFPLGKLKGREWCVGDIYGNHGDSLRVNLDTGKWADFATDARGGDLISLYATINSLSQVEAAKQLSDETGFEDRQTIEDTKYPPTEPAINPPFDVDPPDMAHQWHGQPSMSWCYRNAEGYHLFYVARYETKRGKEFAPWSWVEGRWQQKGYPAPRPLYGLELLKNRPDSHCLVVEGERTADAARQLCGKAYVAVTWPNGVNSIHKTDWTPIYGRKVLVWPDNDKPGIKAAQVIAGLLSNHCLEIKIVDPTNRPPKWDAADALAENLSYEDVKAWAGPRASIFVQAQAIAKNFGALAAAQTNVQINLPDPEDPGNISKSSFAIWNEVGLALTTKGAPICNMDNVRRIFEQMPRFKDFVCYDEFYQRIFTLWKSEKPRELTDQDIINVMGFIQRELGLSRITKEHVFHAIIDYAYDRKRNAPKDWFEMLKWDGVDRLEYFFINCFDTEDNEYTRAVGRNFWIAMVARIYEPGCKFDHLVYLQGPQNIGKSTAWEDIGGEWYVSASYQMTEIDFVRALNGKILVELSELTSVRKADVNAIKEIITRRVDNYRRPYDKMAKDYPRMCVFVGTTNDDLMIPDNTGARRFWPVKCNGSVRNDLIRQSREQYFAEAVARYKMGEPWHKVPEQLAKSIQEELRNGDIWEEKIAEFLTGKNRITSFEILTDCLGRKPGELTQSDKNRVAGVMKFLRWQKKVQWINGKSVRVWTPEDCKGSQSEM